MEVPIVAVWPAHMVLDELMVKIGAGFESTVTVAFWELVQPVVGLVAVTVYVVAVVGDTVILELVIPF